MQYVFNFFTSDETKAVGGSLESSKLSASELSNFQLVKVLKILVGNDEHLPDSTYVFPINNSWKDLFFKVLDRWAELLPKLNEVKALVAKLEEGKYLGVSFNDTLDTLERKKLLLEMQELETGVSTKHEYEDFLLHNEAMLKIYQPHSYHYNERVRFGPIDRKSRVCRYCGKRIPETTFKNVSHTISKSLGNKSFITSDECDNCNAHFGAGIEQEFLRYISVYRSLAARYEGHPYFTTLTDSFRLDVNKITNRACFDIIDKSKSKIEISGNRVDIYTDGGFVNYHDVYRALVKYVIGMLPEEQLPLFKDTIRWVNGESLFMHLPIIKESIYSEPEQHPFLNMFFRKEDSQLYPYLIVDFHVNHLELLYAIPGCQKDVDGIKEGALDAFLKLRNDTNDWRNIVMDLQQPRHRRLHTTFFLKQKE